MHYVKRKAPTIKLTQQQILRIQSAPKKLRKRLEKHFKREGKRLQAEAYDKAKLRSQGLWDGKQKKSKLTVYRISDLTPEQRAEMGIV